MRYWCHAGCCCLYVIMALNLKLAFYEASLMKEYVDMTGTNSPAIMEYFPLDCNNKSSK